MQKSSPRVAVLGLGIMGSGIAQNLLKAGYAVAVYNRTRAKAEPLAALGARIANNPCEAAAEADVIVSMVGNDEASRAMWTGETGALAQAKSGAVLVECSTLSVAWVRELASLAANRPLLDAPVTGSKDAAAQGKLKLFVGGAQAVIEQVRPVLEAFSQEITHMGPSGSGVLLKLVNNMMVAVQAVALAEGLILAERGGLNVEQVINVISQGAPGSPIVKGKAGKMLARDYEDTHFALRWMQKDAAYALRAAEEFGVPLFTVATAREVFQLAQNLGFADADFSAVIEAINLKQ
jgi:3-hydroxyisobutyrate dehydrogenase